MAANPKISDAESEKKPLVDPVVMGAVVRGTIAAAGLIIAIYLGSGKMRYFDSALITYTSAVVLAVFAIVYRYSIWLAKPPTRLYWRKGWQLFARPGKLPHNIAKLLVLLFRSIVAQIFIDKRSHSRWLAHMMLSWGCIGAVGVTFPLVFGWVHFDADPQYPTMYNAILFGIPAGTFPAHSPIGWITFHILDFCAVAVIGGMALAMWRRMSDRGALSSQSFGMDLLPLILLFAVSFTGLMLTVSAMWLKGYSYSVIAMMHAFSVIITLLYLPFGKFFHIFQRPANLGVQFYKEEGAATPQAACSRCGQEFTSQMHVDDLKVVLSELGMDYSLGDGDHYQQVCPTCRRKMLAITQLEAIGGPGFL